MYTFNMKDAGGSSIFQMSTNEVNIDTNGSGADVDFVFSIIGELASIANGFAMVANLTESVTVAVNDADMVTGVFDSLRFRIESDTDGRLVVAVKKA